jgi:hypothetical protein
MNYGERLVILAAVSITGLIGVSLTEFIYVNSVNVQVTP